MKQSYTAVITRTGTIRIDQDAMQQAIERVNNGTYNIAWDPDIAVTDVYEEE